MSFHPNEVLRRGRVAAIIALGVYLVLLGAFFRTQILRNQRWVLQSEENRLRELPLPAPRGVIYDRNGRVIAESVVGYSVALLTQSEDSLRATLGRLQGLIELSNRQVEDAVRRFRRDRNRPAVIIPDASFDIVSVLEEHRIEYPNLMVQSAPKRVYPDGPAVSAFVGYVNEISESELTRPEYQGYKPGHQIGKQGLERQYERELRGREGSRFVEVDARNRIVLEAGARDDLLPQPAAPLYTNIDMDLQLFIHGLFADSLAGGVVAMVPQTGEILALYAAPGYDPNRFIGGIPQVYWDSLQRDPRRPLYNKALQGTYEPGSTWKLATAAIALEHNLVTINDRMPQPCTGAYQFGNRLWRCWRREGHGSQTLYGAIVQSCNVYFYQLGQRVGLSRLVAGGASLGFNRRTGIDLPEERRSTFPDRFPEYFNERYGPRGWTAGAHALNISIGQGDNTQTILNMARFYSALATDGYEPRPMVARGRVERSKILDLNEQQFDQLRGSLTGVVASGGTAAASAIQGVLVAGKTGTAQNPGAESHAWFVGFAPAENAQIVVSVMIEHGGSGGRAARIATRIMEHYLKTTPVSVINTEG